MHNATRTAMPRAVHDAGTRLLFGCMGLGGDWEKGPLEAADVAAAHAAVDAALQAGITVFDHADIYRNGKAEEVFGRVLAERPGLREGIHLQTKCGIVLGTPGAPGRYDSSAKAITARVDGSLARLGVERIDTLLIHRPDPLTPPDEIADAVAALRAAGKVSRLGVSNHSGAQMALLQSVLDEPLAVNQLQLSLGHRGWLESAVMANVLDPQAGGPGADAASFPHGTLEYCAAHGAELQAWGAMDRGRYTRGPAAVPDSDRPAAALVARLADKLDATPEAVVLGWLMRHPARIRPVVGTTSPARIAACAGADTVAARMTGDDWYALWTAARGEPLP
ncbi:aldo/keto reductase family oxidoreductase [Arthrobacter sp. JSM 101049]|uniref:aldo/keto reductase n=1 Tax=Arthrobacter sp. JSM 101049 TaxID=929097 RepID=UPI003566DCD4